jgi:hypothetical protein
MDVDDDPIFVQHLPSHPFGDLVNQHLHRRHGLTQAKLAVGIDQGDAVVSAMLQGKRLTGPGARARVLKMVLWLRRQGVLTERAEADALLAAANMTGLSPTASDDLECKLNKLLPVPVARESTPNPAPPPMSLPQSAITLIQSPITLARGSGKPGPGNAPPFPTLLIGREDDLRNLKLRLGIGEAAVGSIQVLTAMRGWPGVGKTTLAAALAHDQEIQDRFPDGVLWASLGQNPNVFAELLAWGRALNIQIGDAQTIAEASSRLTAQLHTRRLLLIVDDVWKAEHVAPFRVGGRECALLATTRLPEVARSIAVPDAVYVLDVLTPAKALELLRTIAPVVVEANPQASRELVADLEGLPLAIQVAGRLLNVEASYGFEIADLLDDIRAGARLIEAQAPADRTEVSRETTPTVAALLKKSTDLLTPHMLDCFVGLAAFAPKPATFDAAALKSMWQTAHPQPMIRALVDRGLLEPFGDQRYWMHALLVAHARSFLTE